MTHQIKSKRIEVVISLIKNSLISIDDKKHVAVEKAVQSLDVTTFWLLQESLVDVAHPRMETMRDLISNTERLAAINRMLSAGLFEAKFRELTPDSFDLPYNEIIKYISTPFGRSVFARAREKSKFHEALTGFLKTEKGQDFLKKKQGNRENIL